MLKVNSRKLPVRVAFDSGSSHSIMTEHIASQLKPERIPVELIMRGTVSEARVKHAAKVELTNVFPSQEAIEVTAAIAHSLPPTNKPASTQEIIQQPLLKNLHLADPEFGGEIDILIGTYDLPLFLQHDAMKFDATTRLTAASTIFGWVVSGPAPSKESSTILKVDLVNDAALDEALNKMYTLEQVPAAPALTPEETSAIKRFDSSIKQDQDGYYTHYLELQNSHRWGSQDKEHSQELSAMRGPWQDIKN